MPSFDIVSEVDRMEVTNAVDQARREVTGRFDFKGTDTVFDFSGDEISIESDSPGRVDAAVEVLKMRLVRREVSLKALSGGDVKPVGGNRSKAVYQVNAGLSSEAAKELSKIIRDCGLKVQAQIQGDQVRVIGKKRDDLQAAIAELKSLDYRLPLQFTNFRD
jgi:cyclic-di-GMP-binding protein